MANDALFDTIETKQTQHFQDMSSYCMQKTFSDIVIAVGDERIYAHKIVLAARCKFFENTLLENLELTELAIANFTIEPIKVMLRYLYTGILRLEFSEENLIFDSLMLAHEYTLSDLEEVLIAKIGSILDMSNIVTSLNRANQFDVDAARDVCYQFIDGHAEDFRKSDDFIHLSQKSMSNLLQRRTFRVPEIEIFKLVQKWCSCNGVVDTRNLVLLEVSIAKLSIDDILEVVLPSKLFEESKLLKAIAEIRKKTAIVEIKDTNIATSHGAQVITGSDTSYLLTGNTDETKFASHPGGDKNGITIDLGKTYYFNNIKFKLLENRSYRYYLEASSDYQRWDTLIDYTKYECHSYQNLFFDKTEARYVRVIGVYGGLCLINLEVFNRENTPIIINQVIRPVENVATADGRTVVEFYGRNETHLKSSFLANFHALGKRISCVIKLGQPYLISRVSFMLDDDCDFARYMILIELEEGKWAIVANKKNQECTGYQSIEFEERVVKQIKIINFRNSVLKFRDMAVCSSNMYLSDW